MAAKIINEVTLLSLTTLDTFPLVLKSIQGRCERPQFSKRRQSVAAFDSLKIGDTMSMKGPKGHFHWLGRGRFTTKKPKNPLETKYAKVIGMIAGGTGITPMLQILHAIFQVAGDQTCCNLLYANQTTSI
jgi:ferredoxin-NADP reductase